jgi:integrase
MKSEALTAKQVHHMKPGETRYEVAAGPPSGLYLIVQPTGGKSWALRYRWHGMTRKLTLGAYPDTSLAAARGDAEARLAELETGIDPATEKAIEKAQANPETVAAVADEWLTRYVKRNLKTWREVEWLMNKEVLPVWKHKLITDVTKADVIRLLDGIVDRGAPVQANRVRSWLLSWFNWCVDERAVLQSSPVTGTKRPVKEKSRERVLEDDELAAIWSITAGLGYPSGHFIRFLMLSVQRRGEVAAMRWEDVDLSRGIWTLPAWATKPGRVHDVPLSGPMLAILRELPRFDGVYAFSTTSGAKPINGFSKQKARVDAALKDSGNELADWIVHDLRRTGATWMAGAGVLPQVLSALLNHSPGSLQGVTAIYNRHRYVEERRAALEQWAVHITALEAATNGFALKVGT